jgi:glutathione synthase/RimK-type ligase-like ATP-grasp enzyme
MTDLYLLTDYRNVFGSKHFDKPYRSGYSKDLLHKYFFEQGINLKFVPFSELNFRGENYRQKIFLYTSSEDIGYRYKSYLEDIIAALDLYGAIIIPTYKYLRANNNKVFMELLRDSSQNQALHSLKAYSFGCLEELLASKIDLNKPWVIKTAEGASGSGVYLGKDRKSSIRIIKKISRTPAWKYELWDRGRKFKHSDYRLESRHRNKFILQEYIPELKNDWKIYVFGKRLFVFFRPIFKHRDIRASGGGYDNYFYGSEARIVDGLLDFAWQVFNCLDVPHTSLDIGYDGTDFYLFEFQCLYFGTAGIPYSNDYFLKTNKKWEIISEKIDIEKVYSESIVEFLKRKNLI